MDTIPRLGTFRSATCRARSPRCRATSPWPCIARRGTRSAVAASLLSAASIEAVNVPAGWAGIYALRNGAAKTDGA